MNVVIGVDVGGTKIAAHLTDGSEKSIEQASVPTPSDAHPSAVAGLAEDSPEYAEALKRGRIATMQAIIGVCRRLAIEARQQGLTLRGIGVGSAGQIDPLRGMVVDANPNIIGWRGTRIVDDLTAAFGVLVFVDNDVRTMALAETAHGAGAGYDNVLCVTVGTGIGGAMVQNGKLIHGAHYSAGEIGYMLAYGKPIEEVYGGPAIARRYAEEQHMRERLTLVEITKRALKGDTTARQAIESAAYGLGQHLAPVLAFLDPDAMIVGGGVATIGEMWWAPFLHAFNEFPLESVRSVPVKPAALGSRAGMIGAGVLAARKLGLA
ncbi:MAG: ROK family protein [Chloroflexi bacterium]|nr:ROK family protein [Chloroflexota bacterium]